MHKLFVCHIFFHISRMKEISFDITRYVIKMNNLYTINNNEKQYAWTYTRKFRTQTSFFLKSLKMVVSLVDSLSHDLYGKIFDKQITCNTCTWSTHKHIQTRPYPHPHPHTRGFPQFFVRLYSKLFSLTGLDSKYPYKFTNIWKIKIFLYYLFIYFSRKPRIRAQKWQKKISGNLLAHTNTYKFT